MYRPPENSNRVKSIKTKFENIGDQDSSLKKHGTRSDLNKKKNDFVITDCVQNLSRQLSDPSKRNIKRTPAFRIDLSSEKNDLFQRTALFNRSFYASKVQHFNNTSKNSYDKNGNDIKNGNLPSVENELRLVKPVLRKSKSSHDFALIRSKFDKNMENDEVTTNCNFMQNGSDLVSVERTSALYTRPLPKTLRNKQFSVTSDIKSKNKKYMPQDNNETTVAHTSVILGGAAENFTIQTVSADVTDTLRAALNRPLPTGPAPQKPPRTFEHISGTNTCDVHKNTSFLHDCCGKEGATIRNEHTKFKRDARYMLNKLESALRNNKIKTKKTARLESSTTSGEDSDDSVLSKSKTQKHLPSNRNSSANNQSSLNLNCLNRLTTCTTTYEKIKEPNSLFFVNCLSDEPVYAEPFNFSKEVTDVEINNKNSEKPERSLYYMSTSLLSDEEIKRCSNMDENLRRQDTNKISNFPRNATSSQVYEETSSQSSVFSDVDSAASTPLDENESFETSNKIKELINTFEKKQSNFSEKHAGLHTCSDDGSSRIEELKMSLQKTLEKCFDDKCPSSHFEKKENKEFFDTIVNKFQTYVKTMPKYEKPLLWKDERLFYCCLIVSWDRRKPHIKFKFPANAALPDRIEDLCYPEASSGPLDISDNAQSYSLVITNDKGERTFGYCRRVIPEGSNKCIPLTYCLLSKHRAPRFYKKILTELESRHGIPDKLRDELIHKFYYNKFPRPGESIKISVPKHLKNCNIPKNEDRHVRNNTKENSELKDPLDLNSFVHITRSGKYATLNDIKDKPLANNTDNTPISHHYEGHNSSHDGTSEPTELVLTLHQDTRYEEADLRPLHQLPADILLKIFASLLLERKVILISCVISKLSCCVDALQSIIYPFSWPHTFIPILPECLWDVVESPTPVICGILSVSVINDHKIEHGIVVDLDEGNILSEEGDEDNILCNSMKKAWHQGMALAKAVSPEDYVHSFYLSDAYIKVFIVAIKHYKQHINGNTFEKETFIKSGKTKGIRRFLKWFTETTMFLSFIDSVASNPQSYGLFDNKIEIYGSDESDLILTKLLEWKK